MMGQVLCLDLCKAHFVIVLRVVGFVVCMLGFAICGEG